MDSVLTRAKRLMSASVSSALDMAEEASSARLMREAIRQVERAIDTVRAEQRTLATRRGEAQARRAALRDQIATLDSHARFAKSKGREDLATAAISEQLSLESEFDGLAWVQTGAPESNRQFDDLLATLTKRQARMAEDLAAFESGLRVLRSAPADSDDANIPALKALSRAEQTFYRALSVAGGAGSAAIFSEVEAIRRADLVAVRLAALSESAAENGKSPGKKKSSRAAG